METWPSPAMATCPSRRTHRMVVPCQPVGSGVRWGVFCMMGLDGAPPRPSQGCALTRMRGVPIGKSPTGKSPNRQGAFMSSTAAELAARLDRLPMTRHIWHLVTLISLGGCFELYDLFLTAYIAPGLNKAGYFTPD